MAATASPSTSMPSPTATSSTVGARVIAPAERPGPGADRHPARDQPVRSAARAAGRAGAARRALDLSGRPTARLALGVDSGRYRLAGQVGAGAVPDRQAPAADRRRSSTSAATRRSRTASSTASSTLGSPELRAVARGRASTSPTTAIAAMRLGVDLLQAAGPVPEHDRARTCAWCGRSTARSRPPIIPIA